MAERIEFTLKVKWEALIRQNFRCASCAAVIHGVGESGTRDHAFGERAEAHHVRHAMANGDGDAGNCVVVCHSCHYSAHGGGHFQDNTEQMQGKPSDYPCYDGDSRACKKLAKDFDKRFHSGR